MKELRTTVYAASGKQTVRQNISVCPEGECCHVLGNGIERYGSAWQFSREKLLGRFIPRTVRLENLVGTGKGEPAHGSGTILESKLDPNGGWRCVVLMSSHTLIKCQPQDFVVQWPYWLDPGCGGTWQNHTEAYVPSPPDGHLQGNIVRVLEESPMWESDYALVEATLRTQKTSRYFLDTSVPRLGRFASTDTLVLGLSHPRPEANGETMALRSHPMQASPGIIYTIKKKFHDTEDRPYYAYASCYSWFGSSGGGVYNTDHELVGIIKGRHDKCQECPADIKTLKPGTAIVNLDLVVRQNAKAVMLSDYMQGKTYL